MDEIIWGGRREREEKGSEPQGAAAWRGWERGGGKRSQGVRREPVTWGESQRPKEESVSTVRCWSFETNRSIEGMGVVSESIINNSRNRSHLWNIYDVQLFQVCNTFNSFDFHNKSMEWVP